MHVVALAICILLAFAPGARAASFNQAGLIVDYGDGSTSWVWVPFEEEELSIFEVLERSKIDLVTVGFGGLGEGVCQIGPTGCSIDDCRKRMCQTTSSSPFWRVMVLDGDTWRMAASGVSGTKVGDGDIVALSWSSATPDLPVLSIDELTANANADAAADQPLAAIRTEGRVDDVDDSAATWAPVAGTLGAVVLASGALMFRAKSSQQDAA